MPCNIEQAGKYYEMGFNLVPIIKGTKIPPKDFPLEEVFSKPLSWGELQKWLFREDVGNIAVVTGPTSKLAVVDIDDPTKIAKYASFKPTQEHSTPSGGRHLLYEYPMAEALGKGYLEKGVELFAGGQYILLPPSIAETDKNGVRKTGAYTVVRNGGMTVIPLDYIATMVGGRKDQVNLSKYTRKDMQDMINYIMVNNHFHPQQHDDALLYGSMYLFSQGWAEEAILALMLRADANDPTPHGAKEVHYKVSRAKQYAQNYREQQQEKEQEVQNSTQVETLSLYDLNMRYENYEIDWTVNGWLPSEAVLMVSALPQRFKTWLMADLALSLVMGVPFADVYPVEKKIPVIFVQQEDNMPRFLNRLNTILAHKYEENYDVYNDDPNLVDADWIVSDVEENMHIVTTSDLSFNNKLSFDLLEQRIVSTGAKFCIIDPFYSLNSDAGNYFAEAGQAIREIVKGIRNRTGCGFIFIHHNKKPAGEESLDRSQVWGSQFVSASTEGVMTMANLRNYPANKVAVRRYLKDGGEVADTAFEFDITFDDRGLAKSYAVYEVPLDSDDSYIESVFLDWALAMGQFKPMEARNEFPDYFPNGARLNEYLTKLMDDGKIIKVKYGTYAVSPDIQI